MNNEPVAWGWYDLEIKRFFPHWDEDLMENKEGCIPLYTHQYERPHNTVLVPCDKLAEMQAEIEALKAGKIRAYDNGVEDGRKPNTNPVKELTREDRLKLIGTLKWAEDLLREAGHDEAVDEVQDCIMLLRKASEK